MNRLVLLTSKQKAIVSIIAFTASYSFSGTVFCHNAGLENAYEFVTMKKIVNSKTNSGELYSKVMKALKFEPGLNETNITVSINENGIVTIGGTVESYTERRLAEKALERLAEIKGIANELEVTLSPYYERTDVAIVRAALNALKWKFLVPEKDIKVTVHNGHLTLDGEVAFQYQKKAAKEAVQDLYGVTFITNNISLKSTIPPEEVKRKITEEFERNARIDAQGIDVEVDGGIVTLRGHVKNYYEKREAKTAAWSIPGVILVYDHIKISP